MSFSSYAYTIKLLVCFGRGVSRMSGRGAENAGVENAVVENTGVDSRGGKCRSGKYRSENVWKAVKAENKLYH